MIEMHGVSGLSVLHRRLTQLPGRAICRAWQVAREPILEAVR